jgi:hypothetical protein
MFRELWNLLRAVCCDKIVCHQPPKDPTMNALFQAVKDGFEFHALLLYGDCIELQLSKLGAVSRRCVDSASVLNDRWDLVEKQVALLRTQVETKLGAERLKCKHCRSVHLGQWQEVIFCHSCGLDQADFGPCLSTKPCRPVGGEWSWEGDHWKMVSTPLDFLDPSAEADAP